MLTFHFMRHTPRDVAGSASTHKPAANSGFQDSEPETLSPNTRGWFDSSADLKGGLQVQEEDFDSLPPEYQDVFSSR